MFITYYKMYNLSVGCLFKNESHCMKEWIEHYLHHGVDHFYMINDNSNDDFMPILNPYINNNIVTLFNDNKSYYTGRQRDMYNTFILPKIKETKWLLMIDMDEFVWSPTNINLNDILNTFNHIGQIQIYDVLYGSNGFIEQPSLLVNSFTMRQKEPRRHLKYFVNTNYEFSSLNVHHATFVNKHDEIHHFKILDHHIFILNHYNCQSLTFWNDVKCTRGDSDNYLVRTPEDFIKLDCNEIEDLRLKEQNKNIIYKY